MKRLITVIIVCSIILLGCRVNHSNKLKSEWEQSREVITIAIRSGDTLDEIGYKYKPSWMDVREYREAIRSLNNMPTSDLYVGSTLDIYVERGE
jgi:hypothetical protein